MTDEELAAQAEADRLAAEAKEAEQAAEAERKSKDQQEKNDKPKITDAEARALKDLMKWKEKAKAEEKARQELEAKYGDLDIESARNALKAIEEAETKEMEKKGEYDRLLAKQREAADAKIAAEAKRAADLEAKIAEMAATVDKLAIGNTFANSKFIQENLALTANKTQALYAGYFDIEDGQLIAYDKPKGSANRTPIVDARGEAKPFDEALADIINADPDKDYLLRSNQRPGAGSKPAADTGKEKTPQYASTLDKLAAGVKNPKNFGYGTK